MESTAAMPLYPTVVPYSVYSMCGARMVRHCLSTDSAAVSVPLLNT